MLVGGKPELWSHLLNIKIALQNGPLKMSPDFMTFLLSFQKKADYKFILSSL